MTTNEIKPTETWVYGAGREVNSPSVSVIIPVFNGGRYLREALVSVLGQSFSEYEIIVADNASTDESVRVAQGFHDRRVRVYTHQEYLPIYANFNRAAMYARGKYLKFLCADDVLLPKCLEHFVAVMDIGADIGLAGSARVRINEVGQAQGLFRPVSVQGEISGRDALMLAARNENYLGEPSSVMLRGDVFRSLGGFDQRLQHLGDFDLWCRIMAMGCHVYYSPMPFSCTRIHAGQLSRIHFAQYNLLLCENLLISARFARWGRQAHWNFMRRLLAQWGFALSKGRNMWLRLRGADLCPVIPMTDSQKIVVLTEK